MSTTSPFRFDVSRTLLKHIYAEYPPKLEAHSIGKLKPDKLKTTLTKASGEERTVLENDVARGSEATRYLRAGAVSPLFQPEKGLFFFFSGVYDLPEVTPIMGVVIYRDGLSSYICIQIPHMHTKYSPIS